MRTIIGIDPGMKGGIALRTDRIGKAIAYAMPETEGDVLETLREIKAAADIEGGETVCVLEEVSGFVGKAQPGSSMFKFGNGYGFLRGVARMLGMRVVLVRPQRWQKWFALGTARKCGSKRKWKNKLKDEAQRRFPEIKVTLGTADALLILEWGVKTGV